MKRPILSSAIATLVCLSGGLLLGVGLGFLVNGLPFHAPVIARSAISVIFALVGVFGGAALWGSRLSRIHNLPNRSRVMVASGLSFGLSVIGAGVGLINLARVLVGTRLLPGVPTHVIFTMVFVPAMFLVAAIGASTIMLAGGRRLRWLASAATVGLAAALTFLVVDLLLDALGMRVGGPGAEQRFTMLSVAFLSSAAGAFAGGAMLGRTLARALDRAGVPQASPANPPT